MVTASKSTPSGGWRANQVSEALKSYESELTEFASMVAETMPSGMIAQFEAQYEAPKYLKPDDIGDDRVCSRCGAIVHAGAKRHHSLYHRNLTMGIWMLQGATLAHLHLHEKEEKLSRTATGKRKKT